MEAFEYAVIDFIRGLYQDIGWAGVVVAMAIESACIPLPSEIIMPLAGWMLVREAGHDLPHLLWAGFYGALGCTVGSAVAYWVGALGGRPLLIKYGKYILVSEHHIALADRWFERWGEATAFFSRLVPVVRTFISLPAGVSRMHFGKFLIYSFLGSFPWSLGLAYAGFLAGEHWESVRRVMRPLDIPIALAVLAAVAIFLYRNFRARQASMGED